MKRSAILEMPAIPRLARQKTVHRRLVVVVLGAALVFIICYTILKIILG